MIADALVWKYGYANGLVIVDGVITQWPVVWPQKPNKAGIDAIADEYSGYLQSIAYKEKRKKEYPDIGDQLDVIWKAFNRLKMEGIAIGIDADGMISSISAIKTKYPKS